MLSIDTPVCSKLWAREFSYQECEIIQVVIVEYGHILGKMSFAIIE
jgi:hypothetical protein